MKNTSELLLEKGSKFYNFGAFAFKRLLLIGVAVVLLISLISLFGWGMSDTIACLLINSYYGFVNFLTVVAYICILIGLAGIPFYFMGLHCLGLGQIAKNTEEK